jgi:hypothetical protein
MQLAAPARCDRCGGCQEARSSRLCGAWCAARASLDVGVCAGAGQGVAVAGLMDPCEAGQLEACAQERIAEKEESMILEREAAAKAATSSATGSPYRAPGGRWGRFKKYSTFQVAHREWPLPASARHSTGCVLASVSVRVTVAPSNVAAEAETLMIGSLGPGIHC